VKRKLNSRLVLSKETLRTLEEKALDQVEGGATTATTGGSNSLNTCESCAAVCSRYC
jgi:hypothetical protein